MVIQTPEQLRKGNASGYSRPPPRRRNEGRHQQPLPRGDLLRPPRRLDPAAQSGQGRRDTRRGPHANLRRRDDGHDQRRPRANEVPIEAATSRRRWPSSPNVIQLRHREDHLRGPAHPAPAGLARSSSPRRGRAGRFSWGDRYSSEENEELSSQNSQKERLIRLKDTSGERPGPECPRQPAAGLVGALPPHPQDGSLSGRGQLLPGEEARSRLFLYRVLLGRLGILAAA